MENTKIHSNRIGDLGNDPFGSGLPVHRGQFQGVLSYFVLLLLHCPITECLECDLAFSFRLIVYLQKTPVVSVVRYQTPVIIDLLSVIRHRLSVICCQASDISC